MGIIAVRAKKRTEISSKLQIWIFYTSKFEIYVVFVTRKALDTLGNSDNLVMLGKQISILIHGIHDRKSGLRHVIQIQIDFHKFPF